MDASQHRELSLEGRMSRGEYIRKKAIVAIFDEVMNEYGHDVNIYLVRNKIVNELKATEYE